MLKSKYKFIIAIFIIASTLTYLVFAGVKDTMVYYLTIDELMEKVPAVHKDKVRVSGTVVPGSIVNEVDDSLKFKITDGTTNVDVEYSGVIPDIFKDDVEAVVEGVYTPEGVFKADLLLAKCPTKYESEEELYQNQEKGYKKGYKVKDV